MLFRSLSGIVPAVNDVELLEVLDVVSWRVSDGVLPLKAIETSEMCDVQLMNHGMSSLSLLCKV